MRTYLLKRLLLMLPTLFVICLLSYGMMRLAPGDPAAAGRATLLGEGASSEKTGAEARKAEESEARRQFRRYFHLDQPWPVGFKSWLIGMRDPESGEVRSRGVLRGDFGRSINVSRGTGVWELLAGPAVDGATEAERERQRAARWQSPLLVSIKLDLWATAVIYLIAIPAGLFAAVRRGGWFDRASSGLFFLLYSLPSFWIGLLLIIAVSRWFPDWPTRGLASALDPEKAGAWAVWTDTAKAYVLPVLLLSYGSFAGLSRYVRAGLLEVVRQDYIRTARAKGLSEWRVILKHALRNSLIPLVTLFAGLLPGLISGSLIVEYLFNIPGMGLLSVTALNSRDYPVLMTIFGLSALLTLIGILISDLLYAVVDPRITFD